MDRGEFSSYLERFLNAKRDDIVKDLLEFLKIPSIEGEGGPGMPFGKDVHDALGFFKTKAQDMGFETKDVDGYAVHAELGEGEEMAMALTHADIVPVGSGWTHDPYGEVSQGRIFGRGTQDDKGPTIACLYALYALKESGVPLKRRVRHVVGGNEETGFRCVRHYFSVEEYPTYGFSPDAYFPLVFAEKGSMNVRVKFDLAGQNGDCTLLDIEGGERANIVCDHAEAVIGVTSGEVMKKVKDFGKIAASARENVQGSGFLQFSFSAKNNKITVSVKGRAAHASTPEKGINALTGLMHFLEEVDGLGRFKDAFSFAAYAGDIYGKGLSIESKDDVSGHLTCNLGLGRMEGTTVVCTYNIRFPVKESGDALTKRALGSNMPKGVEIEVFGISKPHYAEPDSYLVKTLLDVYRKETGDRTSKPMAIGGGTYARVIPGGVAFGPVKPGQPDLAHQADEYIAIKDLLELTKIYAKALYELSCV